MPERSLHPVLQSLKHGLIVSCQAEGDDPFNSPPFVAAFARAAEMGGACGIRARDPENIRAIRAAVSLPVIGITKGAYPDGCVLITPGMEDVSAVIAAGADIVAVDATARTRSSGQSGAEFISQIRRVIDAPLMGDVSTVEEGIAATQAGADLVSTTLSGYTPGTQDRSQREPDWDLLAGLVRAVKVPVILEGRVWTPEEAKRGLDMGAFAVVVGTAITRPRLMTKRFVEVLRG